jgi:DNA-binding XRE family transcriptional regulator
MAMKLHRWKDVRRKALSPERQKANDEWIKKELESLQLRELRELSGLTQEEAAKLLDMTQAELSKMERREDHKLSTLRRYVQALGGELEVIARFGPRTLKLRDV